MKNLTKIQKTVINNLSTQIKISSGCMQMYSDDSRDDYTLEELATDLQRLKKQIAALEEAAIHFAFEAVNNNQKQEA